MLCLQNLEGHPFQFPARPDPTVPPPTPHFEKRYPLAGMHSVLLKGLLVGVKSLLDVINARIKAADELLKDIQPKRTIATSISDGSF